MHSEHMVRTNGYDSYLTVIDGLSCLISLIWLSNNFIVASVSLASEVFPDVGSHAQMIDGLLQHLRAIWEEIVSGCLPLLVSFPRVCNKTRSTKRSPLWKMRLSAETIWIHWPIIRQTPNQPFLRGYVDLQLRWKPHRSHHRGLWARRSEVAERARTQGVEVLNFRNRCNTQHRSQAPPSRYCC